MKYNIRGKNVDITEGIENHLISKLSKLDKYLKDSDDITANVLARVYDTEQKIEVTIPTKLFTLRIEERHPDLYSAIDHAADKLERQIRKHKTKIEHHEGGFKAFNLSMMESGEETEENVVRNKKVTLRPMSLDDAIIQMELLHHDFFLYHDSDVNGVCVVYKRKNGDYGVLETA
jgi:putative sigma-54 modulation protein